jgi:hypothetical protein
MTMATITVEDMRNKLRTVDQLEAELRTTEPMELVPFEVGNQVRFRIDPEWETTADDLAVVEAEVRLGARDFALTKEALLEATSLCGLPKGYVLRTPAHLIEDQLNYWFRTGLTTSQGDGKAYKLLSAEPAGGGVGHAFTRANIQPFSNLALLEMSLDSIRETYRADADDVLVDYKGHHSFRSTTFRLIVPEQIRQIRSARHTSGNPDNWSMGVRHLRLFGGLVSPGCCGQQR